MIALLCTILGALLGQANARFFLEPFYWGLMGLISARLLDTNRSKPPVVARALICLQASGVAGAIVFGILTISVGSIGDTLRSRVMHTVASDYSAMRWVDDILPSNAIVITDLRSTGLVPRQAYPTDWSAYLGPEDPYRFSYLPRLNPDMGPIYLLTNNKEPTSVPTVCLVRPYVGALKTAVATRNPWNRGSHNQVFIYELRKDCAL
jgi:hypothetical protein